MKGLLVFTIMMYCLSCSNDAADKEERKDGYSVVLKSKEDSLFHEVMTGHDVGMAKIGKLRKHLKQIEQELDSINKVPAGKINQQYKAALLDLQDELKFADQSMYTWMVEFKADSVKDDKGKRLDYLESERVKVEKVKHNILSSMDRADSLLRK